RIALRIAALDLGGELDPLLAHLPFVEIEGGEHRGVEGKATPRLRALLIGERSQVADDAGDPARLLLQGAELLFVGSTLELLAKQRRDAGDGGDRIVQLVRHSGAQRAERGEAPGAEDLILRHLELDGPRVDPLLKLAVPAADLLVAPHDLARHLV